MRRPNERLQKIVLRIMALVSLPVLPAIFAPGVTVEKLSWFTGFGQPPDVPLINYLAAGGSFVYVALSALLWMMSNDVVRHRPLIVASAWICLVAVPVYLWVDWHVGMPRWWVLMDAVSCLVGGVVLLRALGTFPD